MSSAEESPIAGLRRCHRCPHRLSDLWQHIPEVASLEKAEESQSMRYWEDDESIASQVEHLEIRGGGLSQPESQENSDDELSKIIADSTNDSGSISTDVLNDTGIGTESGISCLAAMKHLIPCPRCSSPSYKPELWFDGPEGTTTLGHCSKCSSILPFYEAPPPYDD